MGKKLLVLDDDQDLLDILSFILTESGYNVRALTSGENIFEEIEAYWPDLIIMDVLLNRLDGRVICKSIKENRKTSTIPVILISSTAGLTQPFDLPGAPNDFIAKPFDMDDLLNRVAKLL